MLHGCISQSHRSNRIASLESHRIARIASHRSNRSQGIARWNRSLAGCLALLVRSLLARPVALAPTPADVLFGLGGRVGGQPGLLRSTSTFSHPTTEPLAGAAGSRRRLASKRRARVRRSVRDAEVRELDKSLAEAHQKLSERNAHINSLSSKFFEISQELQSALDDLGQERRSAAITLARTEASLRESHCEERIRLESLHEIALENAKAQAAAARAQDRLELERLLALTKRLRSERDQARADALRYCEERNTLRKTVAELRLRQSEAAVRDAARVRLSFPGAE